MIWTCNSLTGLTPLVYGAPHHFDKTFGGDYYVHPIPTGVKGIEVSKLIEESVGKAGGQQYKPVPVQHKSSTANYPNLRKYNDTARENSAILHFTYKGVDNSPKVGVPSMAEKLIPPVGRKNQQPE